MSESGIAELSFFYRNFPWKINVFNMIENPFFQHIPGTTYAVQQYVNVQKERRKVMSLETILIIVILIVIFGGGGFYWTRRR